MSTKVLLLLAAVICVAVAQTGNPTSSRCLCRRTRDKFGPTRAILDIQIYPPSHSCDKMEVVVTLKIGVQYCLDPKMKKVQDLLKNLQKTQASPTSMPQSETTELVDIAFTEQ